MDFVLVENNCRPGKTIYDNYEDSLFSCLRLQGDSALSKIQENLNAGVDLELCYRGVTFLGAACWLGRLDVVDLVLTYEQERKKNNAKQKSNGGCPGRKKSCIDTYDVNGYTPLLLAICGGHFEICCLLVEAGADINLPHQTSKQTPLVMAVEQSRDAIVTYLLDNHADVQLTDNVGISPLYVAIKCQKEEIVKQLIDADCDVDIGSQDHTPIFLATRMGQLNIVKLLCEAGCHKDVRNKYGVTPVYEASLKGRVEVLAYLLDQECSPNITDMYDQSPLHVAVISAHLPCVKLLIEAGANWKLRNHHRETAIDIAMAMGRTDILEYFMEDGIDILPKTYHPSGLKHLVSVFEQGHTSSLSLLIRGCARLPILHSVGVLPIFRNNSHLLKLLLMSGIQTIPGNLLAADFCKEDSDWLNDFRHNPRDLKQLCRVRVRRSLGNKVLFGSQLLPLPKELKDYITMKFL